MGKFAYKRALAIVTSAVVISVGYTNCGESFSAEQLNSIAGGSLGEEPVQPDTGPLTICETELRKGFQNSYWPMLSQPTSCAKCHTDTGASPVKFASSNITNAFNAFQQVGVGKVDQNAVNPSHASGVTGPARQAEITAARAIWNPAVAAYNDCVTKPGGGGDVAGVLDLDQRNVPELYFADNRSVILSWDLNSNDVSPAANRFAGRFSMTVTVKYETDAQGVKQAVGYEFKDPTIEMFTGEQEAYVEGIIVRVNGAQPSAIEPLLSATGTARRIDPVKIYNGSVVGRLTRVSSGDAISVSFGFLQVRARTDNIKIPRSPKLVLARNVVSATTVGVTISDDQTATNGAADPARRWCLTTSSIRPASTAAACPGYETMPDRGWKSARPNVFDLANAVSIPADGSRTTVYVWIANADLKINETSERVTVVNGQNQTVRAYDEFVYDITAPVAPTLSSVSLNGSQVIWLNGLSSNADFAEWCVKEGSTSQSVDGVGNCAFSAARPAFTVASGAGNRYVKVVVRDAAGNANQSVVYTVNNTYGYISFVQLAGSGGDKKSVLTNNCASCHGSSGANAAAFAKWNSTDYAGTVAKKAYINTLMGQMDSNTQSGSHPSRIPDEDRALLRKWLAPSQPAYN